MEDSGMAHPAEAMEIDGMEAEDDDDPIVQEIPVFWNRKLADNLCIFQHPLRPRWKQLDSEELVGFRMKPKQYKLEMDFAYNKEKTFYDQHHHLSGIEKKTLTSTKVDLKTNYAVGVYQSGELHLTPINHVLQFKPSFKPQDEAAAALDNFIVRDDEDEEPPPPVLAEEETPTLKPLQIQFKKKESQKAINARKKEEAKKAEEQESWIELTSIGAMDPESMNAFDRLFSDSRASIPIQMQPKTYLEEINPFIPAAPTVGNQQVGQGLETLRNLPLDKQIISLLRNAHIISMKQLREFIPSSTEQQILAQLERVAVLVRGCWFLRSELKSNQPKERIMRDYLLWQFHQNPVIHRKEFAEVTDAPAEVAKEMISSVAVFDSQLNGWRLKIDQDFEFEAAHKALVESFDKLWAERGKMLLDSLATLKMKATRKEKTEGAKEKSDKFVGNSKIDQLQHFFFSMFKKFGVCNAPLLKENLQSLQKEKDPANLLADVTEDDFNRALKEMAGTMHNAFYLKKHGNNLDKFRDIVLEVFAEKRSLKRVDIAAACETHKEEIPTAYTKVLKELATCKAAVWTFKSGC